MRSLTINHLQVSQANGRITITGTFITNGYTNDEIKKMIAAILQSVTNKGNINGQPDTNKVNINGNAFTGSDTL